MVIVWTFAVPYMYALFGRDLRKGVGGKSYTLRNYLVISTMNKVP